MSDTIYITCHDCGRVFAAALDDGRFACPHCDCIHHLWSSHGELPRRHSSVPARATYNGNVARTRVLILDV